MSIRHDETMLKRLLLALMVICAPLDARASIVVASKIDTEGSLLGNMILLLLQQHGIAATGRLQLGPTQIVRQALIAGEIDVYPEYTGNGAFFFHQENDPAWRDATRGYDRVKALDARNGLVWLTPAPANNTWAIAVRRDLKLATLEDFARYVVNGGQIRLAASAEFVNSPGGLPSFETTYDFALTSRQLLTLAGGNTAATTRAAAEHISSVNAAMAYGTDGALSVLGLVALRDDRGAQIVYRPAPVVREKVLKANPNLPAILNPAFSTLTLPTLQSLNAKISIDGMDARTVAARYLETLAK